MTLVPSPPSPRLRRLQKLEARAQRQRAKQSRADKARHQKRLRLAEYASLVPKPADPDQAGQHLAALWRQHVLSEDPEVAFARRRYQSLMEHSWDRWQY